MSEKALSGISLGQGIVLSTGGSFWGGLQVRRSLFYWPPPPPPPWRIDVVPLHVSFTLSHSVSLCTFSHAFFVCVVCVCVPWYKIRQIRQHRLVRHLTLQTSDASDPKRSRVSTTTTNTTNNRKKDLQIFSCASLSVFWYFRLIFINKQWFWLLR